MKKCFVQSKRNLIDLTGEIMSGIQKKRLIINFQFPDGNVPLLEFTQMLEEIEEVAKNEMPSCDVFVSLINFEKGEKND